jgi:hypothetical protein
MQLRGTGKRKHELKNKFLVKHKITKKLHAYVILFKNAFIIFLLYKIPNNGNNKDPK